MTDCPKKEPAPETPTPKKTPCIRCMAAMVDGVGLCKTCRKRDLDLYNWRKKRR